MEWPSSSPLPRVEGVAALGGVRSANRSGGGGGGDGAAALQRPGPAPPHPSTVVAAASAASPVTVGEAMDIVALQCERRGLTSAATWLGEMGLHGVPSLMSAAAIPAEGRQAHPTNSISTAVAPLQAVLRLDAALTDSDARAVPAYGSPTRKDESHDCDRAAAARVRWQRLHRVALGYLTRGEYQRCHHVILGEIMRHTACVSNADVTDAAGDGYDAAVGAAPVAGLPSPAVVRGFRSTTVPPLLQFVCLYALYMDGVKIKQLSSNAAAAQSGGNGGGSQRALHPHARVLRAYLLEAMRNPINAIPPAPSSAPCEEAYTPGPVDDSCERDEDRAAELYTALGQALTEGPHRTPPATRQPPWTTSSASRPNSSATAPLPATTAAAMAATRGVGVGGGRQAATSDTAVAAASPASTAASSYFSNASPGAVHTPAAASASAAAAAAAAGGSGGGVDALAARDAADLMHVDPYLTWLMGVVLRELRMRQESATFLLAAVSVNPLLRSAWEDLACLVSREAQLAELDAALEGLEPFFMVDLFAAEVRALLGVTPVASARLRAAAAAATSSDVPASAPQLTAASPNALNAASGTAPQTAEGLGTAAGSASTFTGPSATTSAAAAALASALKSTGGALGSRLTPPPPTASAASGFGGGSSSPSPAAPSSLSNAWECLALLFPDTPYVLSQLAHYVYHQRNRLDRAEALYQRIRALDPHYLAILYDYSNVLYTKRDRLGLSSLVQSVYHADPFRAETNFAAGNYYVLLGQHDRAALHFHRATAIDPQCAEAWLLLGHAYVEVKNTTAAVEAYRTAVELNERDYRGWYNLGQIYELLEAYHHALYYYWHTTSLRPADPGMWVAVANCLEHDGRIAESIACLERAETYDSSASSSYPAYVRRIAMHHIANSSFTRACVYLEKLAQSAAATAEDRLLAYPFIIQHYVQRARTAVEVFARSSSYDPALFSPGTSMSPLMLTPGGAAAGSGRTALHQARAAAALQHLNRAEEHLRSMAELVMPAESYAAGGSSGSGGGDVGAGVTASAASAASGGDRGEVATGSGAEENSAPGWSRGGDEGGAGRRRTRGGAHGIGSTGGSAVPASSSPLLAGASAALAAAVAAPPTSSDPPPVAFVRTRLHEMNQLRAQAMHMLQAGHGAGGASPATAAASSSSTAPRNLFAAPPQSRYP